MSAKYALAIIIVLALSIQCVIGINSVVNRCDINQDGIINIQDLVLVADNLGKTSDYPLYHIHIVGDRVRGFVRRINDNPENSFIGLSYTDPAYHHDEFRFYVDPKIWVPGLPEFLHNKLNIDLRITGLRPDGSYDAILLTPWTIEDLLEN